MDFVSGRNGHYTDGLPATGDRILVGPDNISIGGKGGIELFALPVQYDPIVAIDSSIERHDESSQRAGPITPGTLTH